MNKGELIKAIAEDSEVSKKDAENVLNSFIKLVEKELVEGGKVQLIGFGTFEVIERAARIGRNPSTGEAINIKASKIPKFKPGTALKDKVNY